MLVDNIVCNKQKLSNPPSCTTENDIGLIILVIFIAYTIGKQYTKLTTVQYSIYYNIHRCVLRN